MPANSPLKQPDVDTFWDDCSIVGRDARMVSGAPIVRDNNGNLTRLPVEALTDNVEAFVELDGMSEDQAIEATLEQFPSTPGGAQTIRTLLAHQASHLAQVQP